jgi:Zn-dependent protease with chaperone function
VTNDVTSAGTPGPGAQWSGFYYDGHSARRHPVQLVVTAGGLRIVKADGQTIVWSFESMRQTQGRHEREHLRIEHGSEPAESVSVVDAGLAEAIRAAAPGASRTLRERTSTARVVAWSVAGIVAFAVVYFWGAPAAADWTAARMPASWETELGRGVGAQLLTRHEVCTDSTVTVPVRVVLDRILRAARPNQQYDFRVTVLRDTTINAFAAPGGFLAVNHGLLAAAKTPEEFAGVLAHEVAHVTRRHTTRTMLRDIPMRFAITAVSGGSGMETAAMVAGQVGMLRYRRDFEADADREGVRLLHAAEIDAAGVVSFMRTLEEERSSEPRFVNYLSSHPRTIDRIAQLEALSGGRTGETRPVLDSATWVAVRAGCRK